MHIFVWFSSGFFSLLFTKLVILYVYGQCLLILSCETIWIGLSTLSDIIHVNGAARFRHHLTQNSRTIVPSASPIDISSPSLHQPGFRWKNKNWRDTLCSLDNSRDLEYTFWGFPLWICPMCIIHQTCRCASNYRLAYVILNFVEITGNLNQLLLFHN